MSSAFQWLQSRPAFRGVLSLSCWIPLMIGAAGCGDGSEETPEVYSNLIAVSGIVTLDGAPLRGAAITFNPVGEDAVRPAYGLTDDAGKYELITPVHRRPADQNKGAVPGKYKVVINKLLMANGSEIPKDQTHSEAMRLGAQESLPAVYSDPEKTTLKAEVVDAAEPEPVHFNLKSK